MHIAYCDESADPTRTVASAVVVPDQGWRDAFDTIRDLRRSLSRRYDIPIQYELHARDLVGGKGSPGKRMGQIGRHLGCTVFLEALETLDALALLGVYGVNVSLENRRYHHPLRQAVTWLFQRIENNLTKTKPGEFALVVYDGEEAQHRTMAQRILRRMQVYNPIPSIVQPGTYRRMPVRRILGDPMIRDSADDVFIQMADIMAFALLRQDNPPTHPVSVQYQIVGGFDRLLDIWLTPASRGDPQGVVRG